MKKNHKLNKIIIPFVGAAIVSPIVITTACSEVELTNEEKIWNVLGNPLLVNDEKIMAALEINASSKTEFASVLQARLTPNEVTEELKSNLLLIRELGDNVLADFTEANISVESNNEKGIFEITFKLVEDKSRTLKVNNFLTDEEQSGFDTLFTKLNQISSNELSNNLINKPDQTKFPEESTPDRNEIIQILTSILENNSFESLLSDERLEIQIQPINETGEIVIKIQFGQQKEVDWKISGFKSTSDFNQLYTALSSILSNEFDSQMSISDEDLDTLPSEAIKTNLNEAEIALRMRKQLKNLTRIPETANYLTESLLNLQANDTNGTIAIQIQIPDHKNLNFLLHNFSTTTKKSLMNLSEIFEFVTDAQIQEILKLTPSSTTLASVAAKNLTEVSVKSALQKLNQIKTENERQALLTTKIEIISLDNNGQIQIKINFGNENMPEQSFYISGYKNNSDLAAINNALNRLSNEQFNYEFEIPSKWKSELPQIVVDNYLTQSNVHDKIISLKELAKLSEKIRFLYLEEYLKITANNDLGTIEIESNVPGFDPVTWTLFNFAQTKSSELEDILQSQLNDDNVIPTNNVMDILWPSSKIKSGLPSSYLLPDSENNTFFTKDYIVNQMKKLPFIAAKTSDEKAVLTPESITITANDGLGTIVVSVDVTKGRGQIKQYMFSSFQTADKTNLSTAKTILDKLTVADVSSIFNPYTTTNETNPTAATIDYALNEISISTEIQKVIESKKDFNVSDEVLALFNETAFSFDQIDNTTLLINIEMGDATKSFNVEGFLNPANTSNSLKTVLREISQTELFNALGFDLTNYGKESDLTPYNLSVLTAGNIRWAWFYADKGDQVEQLKRLGKSAFQAFYSVNNIEDYFFITHSKVIARNAKNEVEITFRIKIYDPLYEPPENNNQTEHLLYDHEFNTKNYWQE